MDQIDELRSRIRTAAAQYHAVRISLETAREQLLPLVVEALKTDGIPQKDVIADSGLTREYIRRVARNAGIEGPNPPGKSPERPSRGRRKTSS
jgi:hypothetical protein